MTSINMAALYQETVLFLAVLDPRVGHTMDVLSTFISVLCHSHWLFHRKSCPRLDVVHLTVASGTLLRTHSFVFFAVHKTHRIFLSPFISKAPRHKSSKIIIYCMTTMMMMTMVYRYRRILSRYIIGWLGSRVVSVLDSGAEGPEFKSQPRRCRVTVLGKLCTPIVLLFTKQQNW